MFFSNINTSSLLEAFCWAAKAARILATRLIRLLTTPAKGNFTVLISLLARVNGIAFEHSSALRPTSSAPCMTSSSIVAASWAWPRVIDTTTRVDKRLYLSVRSWSIDVAALPKANTNEEIFVESSGDTAICPCFVSATTVAETKIWSTVLPAPNQNSADSASSTVEGTSRHSRSRSPMQTLNVDACQRLNRQPRRVSEVLIILIIKARGPLSGWSPASHLEEPGGCRPSQP